MSLNDSPQTQQKTIPNILAWGLSVVFMAIAALLLLPQLNLIALADTSNTQINGQVCSGGYYSPSIVNTSPATGSTVTQSSVQITFTADWVNSLTVMRGSTTLATVTGSNQSNETLSTIIELDQGVNNLNIAIDGGCPDTSSTISYSLNYVENSANISNITTQIRSPMLFGHYSPFGVRVFVVLAGNTYEATANPDLTWELPEGIITPNLADGSYDIRVYTMNSSNNIVFDEVHTDAITIDTTAPEVSIDIQATVDSRSPKIEGTVNDPDASITVSVNGYTYTAVNNRDGTWHLPAGTIADLSNGDYSIVVTAEDAAGNKANVSTILRIDAPDQIDFILAPNTGYMRVGDTNIPSSYLYMAVFIVLVILIWLLTISSRRLLSKS